MLLRVCPFNVRSLLCITGEKMLFVSSVSQVCAACVPHLLATFVIHITQALQLHNANAQGNVFLLPQDLLIASFGFEFKSIISFRG